MLNAKSFRTIIRRFDGFKCQQRCCVKINFVYMRRFVGIVDKFTFECGQVDVYCCTLQASDHKFTGRHS